MHSQKRISVAILALGGQGGGVLAEWIAGSARRSGYLVQSTSVPGVAQRTGTTIYYLEMARSADTAAPVFALMPAAGDVDVVIAAELMEVGRAMVRGYVTPDRTTVIGSSHRIYTIQEKSALANGIVNEDRIIEKAQQRSKRFVCFNMEEAADSAGSMISAIMFGALCGSGALPFDRAAFEQEIRDGGVAIDANLRGFMAGYTSAISSARGQVSQKPIAMQKPSTPRSRELADRIFAQLPVAAHQLALLGVGRLIAYQDAKYASLYVERLRLLAEASEGANTSRLVSAAARRLALWMSYEDAIRVADLKTQPDRFERIAGEVKAKAQEIVRVTEFMHPRLEEISDILPVRIGRFLLQSSIARKLLAPFVSKGRHVETTSVRWFALLWLLARFRPLRPKSLRFHEEQRRIESWLELAIKTSKYDAELALEVIECQQLIKGYGDTFERGLRNYQTVIELCNRVATQPSAAVIIRAARSAALKDENGKELQELVDQYRVAA